MNRDPERWTRLRKKARKKQPPYELVRRGNVYRFASTTSFGVAYVVTRGSRTGWQCQCDGFQFSGLCYHVAAVSLIADAEGWPFAEHDFIDDLGWVDQSTGEVLR